MRDSYKICLALLFCIPLYITVFSQPGEQADSMKFLEAVKVEAYQFSGQLLTIPGSMSVLSSKGITISDGTNLAAPLNSLPGVYMQSGTYATNRIVIRGMGSRTPYNSNRIRTYLNDIPLTTADGISTPEEIDLQSLGRIEVIKGPSSALYGSGLGGSVNLYTHSKPENDANFLFQYGSFNTLKTNLSGTIKPGNATIRGNLSHLQSEGYRENNHYQRTSIISTGEWKQDWGSVEYLLLILGINAGIPSSLGKTPFENNPQAAAPNWKAIEGYEENFKGVAGLKLTNKLSDRLTNRLAIFGKWNDSYERRPFNNLDDRSLSFGLRNKLNLHTSKSDWVFGTEWIAEQYEWKIDQDNVLLNENRENRQQLNIFTLVYFRPATKINISVAGAINYISYNLTDLYPGNGDQSGRHIFPVIFSPRVGMNYTPNRNWAVYGSAGHGFSLPSPEETLLPAGDINPDIKPEQGLQFELGTRLSLFDRFLELDGAIYWIELNNLILTKRITEDVFTGINAGRTRHRGFELMALNRWFGSDRFPGQLTSTASYTFSFNRFIDFTDDSISYDGNSLPGIPDQSLRLQLSWNPVHMLELFADLQYTGYQYLNDLNSLKYPGYFLSNLKVKGQFQLRNKDVISLYAGINNLSDTHYASMLIVNAIGFNNSEPRYYYPGLPRHAYTGILFAF